jgi:hypothetical protein
MDNYLDTHYAGFDAERAKAARDDAATRVAAEKAARDRAEDALRRAEKKLQAHQQALDGYWTWRALRDGGESNNGDAPRETPIATPTRPNGNAEAPTGRKAILTLIEDDPDGKEWSIPSIARTLGLGHDAHHAIGVSLSRLARGGLIERPRKGTYTKLAPYPVATGEGAEREMRLAVGSRHGAGQARE